MPGSFRWILLACFGSTALGGALQSQVLSVSAEQGQTRRDHGLGSLRGGQVLVSSGGLVGNAHLRAGLSHARGTIGMIGTLCSGLIYPPSCPDEPLRERRTLTMLQVGASLSVMRSPAVELQIYTDALAGSARIRDRGLSTGGTRSASNAVVGGRLGADARWWPSPRAPIGATLGVAADFLRVLDITSCADCWMPQYDDVLTGARFHLGIVFAGRRR
jgi:hypothetical protein